MYKKFNQIFLNAHKAIHEGGNLTLPNGKTKEVYTSRNGCKAIDINFADRSKYGTTLTVMAQNPNSLSIYAKKARNGEKLSWIIKPKGSWGLIENNQITIQP